MAGPTFSVGGLMSGLDTDGIVRKLVELDRIPINQLQARKQTYQTRINAWNAIKSDVATLRTNVDKLKHLYEFDKLAKATSSHTDVVEAKVTGAVTAGAISFTVDFLAKAHQAASDFDFSSGDDLVGAGTFTVTIDGTDHTVTTDSSTTLTQLARDITGLDAGVKAAVVNVDSDTVKLVITATATGGASQFTASGTQTNLGTFDTVETGRDAQLTIGSGAGALTITRSSNTITDLIDGVELTLKGTSASTVSVATDHDVDAAVSAVKALVDAANAAIDEIATATKYDATTKKAGPLAGDATARRIANDLKNAIADTVAQLAGDYTAATTVGVTLGRDGRFAVDETKLRDALNDDWDAVSKLFARSGSATDSRLDFSTAKDVTQPGSYAVSITQAAKRPEKTGSAYAAPGADETFTVTLGGTSVSVTVTAGSTLASALTQINDQLGDGGITTIRASDDAGAIRLRDSRYGSTITFTVADDGSFGLDGTYTGQDVAGTVGAEAATGKGQTLTADDGDPEGLAIKVTATQDQVDAAGGTLALGNFSYADGIGGRLSRAVSDADAAEGLIYTASNRWTTQIELIDKRVKEMEVRIALRETSLRRRFAAMEAALSTLSAQGNWLAGQVAAMNKE